MSGSNESVVIDAFFNTLEELDVIEKGGKYKYRLVKLFVFSKDSLFYRLATGDYT